MSFTRANPAGWGMYDPLTSAQANIIDINQSRAIDGYAGGTYNPSAIITINQEIIISAVAAVGANATAITATGKGNEPGITSTGGATAGVGVVGNGGVGGDGGYFTGDGVGTGVVGIGGLTNGVGVHGHGTGKGIGGNFAGGSTAPTAGWQCSGAYGEGGAGVAVADGNCAGLVGVGGANANHVQKACAGVYGFGGANGGCGVIGIAVPDGATGFCGVLGSAGTGGLAGVQGDGNGVSIGVRATGGSANGAALHIEPQGADPGAGVISDGDMWIEGSVLHVRLGGATKNVVVAP